MSARVGYGSVILLVASLLCGAAVAVAQTPRFEGSDVEVRVGAVLASHEGQVFDSRLISLRRQFDSLFPYSSYRLVREERRRVGWRREAEFQLPGGRHLLVIPREYKDGRVSMNLMLVQGARSLFNTDVALRNNGTFLVGGPHYNGGVLIIAIGAGTAR